MHCLWWGVGVRREMGSHRKHVEVELEHWGKIGGGIMDACRSHERRFQRELQMFEKQEREKNEDEGKIHSMPLYWKSPASVLR